VAKSGFFGGEFFIGKMKSYKGFLHVQKRKKELINVAKTSKLTKDRSI
jgi:hypothetical protein